MSEYLADYFAREAKGGLIEPVADDSGQLMKGVKSSFNSLGSSAQAFKGALENTPSDLTGAMIRQREGAKFAGATQDFTDIRSLSDAVDWAAWNTGNALGSIATTVAGGGIGGAAVKTVAKQAGQRAMEKAVADGLGDAAVKRAGQVATGRRMLAGQAAGMTAVNYPQQVGGTVTAMLGENDGVLTEEAKDTALAAGVFQAALDTAPVLNTFRKLGIGAADANAVMAKVPRSKVRQIGRDLGAGMGQEGLTEAAQQGIQIAALEYVNPDVDRDVIKDVFNAGMAGAAGGVALGAAPAVANAWRSDNPWLAKKEQLRSEAIAARDAGDLDTAEAIVEEIKAGDAAVAAEPMPVQEGATAERVPDWVVEPMPEVSGPADVVPAPMPEIGGSEVVQPVAMPEGINYETGEVVAPVDAAPVQPDIPVLTGPVPTPEAEVSNLDALSPIVGNDAGGIAVSGENLESAENSTSQIAPDEDITDTPMQLQPEGVIEAPETNTGDIAENGDIDESGGGDLVGYDQLVDAPVSSVADEGLSPEFSDEDFGYEPVGDDQAALDAAANESAESPLNDRPEPTEAQKEAGNYKKGKYTLHGLPLSIENPKGSIRKGVDADGTPWESEMQAHYGDVKGTEGADGDPVDVFLGDQATDETLPVYIVDQVDPKTGEFDEHKVMIGYPDEQAARDGYLANYDEGWQGIGGVTPMPVTDFKDWVNSGATKKPVSDLGGENNQGNSDEVFNSERPEAMPVTTDATAAERADSEDTRSALAGSETQEDKTTPIAEALDNAFANGTKAVVLNGSDRDAMNVALSKAKKGTRIVNQPGRMFLQKALPTESRIVFTDMDKLNKLKTAPKKLKAMADAGIELVFVDPDGKANRELIAVVC